MKEYQICNDRFYFQLLFFLNDFKLCYTVNVKKRANLTVNSKQITELDSVLWTIS